MKVLIGTAGWSYPDWEGAVYGAKANATDRLRGVAEYLDCVEVDSTFYRPPSAKVTAGWAQRTRDLPDFRFLAKAWQRFTHQRDRAWSPAEFAFYADGLQPLREAGKLDAVLFQFPWSFRNEPTSLDWLARVAETFAGWPVAIEFRHDSWDAGATRHWLRERGLIYCNVDQPLLNRCLGPSAHATNPVGYFRCHGRNAANWFLEKQDTYGGRYDYLYNAAEVAELWEHIRQLAARTEKTFVILNNHKDGKAFANALQLKLQAEPAATVKAPLGVIERFPALRGQVRPVGEQQLDLI